MGKSINIYQKKLKMIWIRFYIIWLIICTEILKRYKIIIYAYQTYFYLYRIYVFKNFDIIDTLDAISPLILIWILLFVFIVIFQSIKKNSKNKSLKQIYIITCLTMIWLIPLTLLISITTPIIPSLWGLSANNLIYHAVDYSQPLSPQFVKYKDRSLTCIESMEQLTSGFAAVKPLNDNTTSRKIIEDFYNDETADWTLNSERAERTIRKMIQMERYSPNTSWRGEITILSRRLENARDSYEIVFNSLDEARRQ